jgi:hypothetical protein
MLTHVKFIAHASLGLGILLALGAVGQLSSNDRNAALEVVGFVFGVSFLLVFFGLIRLRPWGRTLASVLAGILIASPFSWYVLWALSRTETKLLFGEMESQAPRGLFPSPAVPVRGTMSEKDHDLKESFSTPRPALMPAGTTLAGRMVKTVDDALVVYRDRDLQSDIVARPAKGTEIQLRSVSDLGGREWLETVLPNGHTGYVLGASVRSHSA